jgi:hypothetical protein
MKTLTNNGKRDSAGKNIGQKAIEVLMQTADSGINQLSGYDPIPRIENSGSR